MATSKRTAADARQPGGTHYKHVPVHLQHWNVVAAMGWDYFIGQATRYLWRLGMKDDAILELDKSIHYLEKKKELILAERVKEAEQMERVRAGVRRLERRVALASFRKKRKVRDHRRPSK